MSDPTFEPVDMQHLMDEGVLMAANEAFFWPLGLALTWTVAEGQYRGGLHIRRWVWEDGHRESIELAVDDEVGIERRERFAAYLSAIAASFPTDERPRVQLVSLGIVKEPLHPWAKITVEEDL